MMMIVEGGGGGGRADGDLGEWVGRRERQGKGMRNKLVSQNTFTAVIVTHHGIFLIDHASD